MDASGTTPYGYGEMQSVSVTWPKKSLSPTPGGVDAVRETLHILDDLVALHREDGYFLQRLKFLGPASPHPQTNFVPQCRVCAWFRTCPPICQFFVSQIIPPLMGVNDATLNKRAKLGSVPLRWTGTLPAATLVSGLVIKKRAVHVAPSHYIFFFFRRP